MSEVNTNFFLNKKIEIEEYNLLDRAGEDFWHSVILVDKVPLSGGCGITKQQSRKIAYSEYLERTKFIEISTNQDCQKKLWGLDIIPTGCGFAAGFDLRNTIIRSLGEAVERWVISKWVDEGYILNEKKQSEVISNLDRASLWYLNQFDDVRFYFKEIIIGFDNAYYTFLIGITICMNGNGIYMGSSAQYNCGNIWQHALVESYRHFRIANTESPIKSFPYNRILFFSKNAKTALNRIANAKNKNWPMPEVIFHKNEYFSNDNFFLSRTIINGWKSWHLGELERFVY